MNLNKKIYILYIYIYIRADINNIKVYLTRRYYTIHKYIYIYMNEYMNI